MSPIARAVVQKALAGNARTGRTCATVSAAKDLRPLAPLASAGREAGPASTTRISRRRLDAIQAALDDRDRQLLLFLCRVRLANGHQLRRACWPDSDRTSVNAARRKLRRLAAWRVIEHLPHRGVGGPRGGSDAFTWHVGVAGARLLDRLGASAKRLATPSDRHVRHTLGLTELLVRCVEADRAGGLELIAWETEPQCWRAYLGTGAVRVILKADAFLRIGAGAIHEDRWCVEWDAATESRATIEGKLRRHLAYRASGSELRDHGVDPRVLWVVPDQGRAAVLARLIERLSADEQALFAVTTHAEAITFLAAEARS